MITNPKAEKVKGFARLKQKQARSETGLFLLEGPQGLSELTPEWAVEVLITPEAAEKNRAHLEKLGAGGVVITLASADVIAKVSDTKAPQGVVAVCRIHSFQSSAVVSPKLVAALENPSDPGNLGAIIRAADAAGADALAVIEPAVDFYNPKVVRATAGSIFHLPLLAFGSVNELVSQGREWGLQLLGASADGLDIRSQDVRLRQPTLWLFGNEAHGLSEAARTQVDNLVSLPIFGSAESLNLATAATLCLYQSALAAKLKD